MRVNQGDPLIDIEFLRPEQDRLDAAGTLEVRLRQRRALIRRQRLVIDEFDRLLETRLAQRRRKLKTRMSGTDDED